jgi:hypothetical protein
MKYIEEHLSEFSDVAWLVSEIAEERMKLSEPELTEIRDFKKGS